MNKLLPPYWLAAFLLFSANQLLEYAGVFIPFVHSYLDDLLAVPIVLGFVLCIQQQFTYRNPAYTLSVYHLIVFVVGLSWYFEWYLPARYSYHYQDIFDIFAYAIGGMFFWYKMNVPNSFMIYKTGRFPYLGVFRWR
jgi:hypothetical protein